MSEPFPPAPSECMRLLEQAREGFRRDGYQSYLLRIALEAQTPEGAHEEEERRKRVAELTSGEANSYAAARRLQEEIEALTTDDGG